MYRVLFRIVKISIHIKQHLSLEVVIKKGAESIVGKESYPLVNGIANVNTTNEFLITKHHPTFQVHVNFTFKKIKKQAGFIHIDLHEWAMSQSYQEIRVLQNSPGGKALIEFGFVYFDFGVQSLMKQLESLEDFEKATNEEYKSMVEQQNFILTEKLQELTNQKQELTQQNWSLSKIEAQYNQIQENLSEQVQFKMKKMNESQDSLKEQEQKSLFLMDLVRKSGSKSLIKSVKQLYQYKIQQQESQNGNSEVIES